MVLTNTHWPGLAILHADLVLVYFATELHLKLQSVAHFYTTVVNTNHTLRPRNGQCTRVFVDKLKDMEPEKTMAEAKEACRLTR